MRKYALVLGLVLLAGCYSSKDNAITGQVKRITNETPLVCPNYHLVDVSLGVMRNGVGSVSNQDIYLYAPDGPALETLRSANKTGAIVDITYDVVRWRLLNCKPKYVLKTAKVVD